MGQPVTLADSLGREMGTVVVGRVVTAAKEPGEFDLEPDRGL